MLPLRFKYEQANTTFQHRGTSLALVPSGMQRVDIDGVRYDLNEIIFHTPSEHKIVGIGYDVEAQFIHSSADGNKAIISVLFAEYDQANKALGKLLNDVPEKGDSRSVSLNPEEFLPKKKTFFTYTGSETSPPCAQGVKWFVFEASESLSQKQLDILSDHIGQNARPIQARGKRKIEKSLR